MFCVRRFFWIGFLAVVFCLSSVCSTLAYEAEINKLSATMAEKIAAAKKTKVAVVDFTDLQGNVTELGRFIAEEFSVALAGSGKGFKVVDRTHLKTLLKEHKLSETGLIDPSTAKQLGQLAGVEALVTGTLTPFGDSVRIAIKILNTDTAELIDANRGNIAKTQAIKELLEKGIARRITFVPLIPPVPELKSKQMVEMKGFSFALQECKKSNKSLTCNMLITNKEKDKDMRLYKSSRIIDNFGNEYKATEGQIGSQKIDYTSVSSLFVTNIPTKTILKFEDIFPQAEIIALLEAVCEANDSFRVQFRNIPISK